MTNPINFQRIIDALQMAGAVLGEVKGLVGRDQWPILNLRQMADANQAEQMLKDALAEAQKGLAK